MQVPAGSARGDGNTGYAWPDCDSPSKAHLSSLYPRQIRIAFAARCHNHAGPGLRSGGNAENTLPSILYYCVS
jgi:hypothetical protein